MIEIKRLIDVRIDGGATTSTVHDVTLGGSNLVRQQFTATSASATNVDFVIQTPGLGVYMSRRVNVKMDIPFQFTLTCPPAGQGGVNTQLQLGEHFGPSAFPLNSMISSATVQISTSNFTTQVQQSLPVMKRYLSRPDIRKRLGEVPTAFGATHIVQQGNTDFSTPIQCGNRSDSTGNYGNSNSYWTITQTDANGNAVSNDQWPYTAVAAGTSGTAYGILHLYEPLLIQPFSIDDEVPAFINTNLINVRLNLTDLLTAGSIKFCSPNRVTNPGPPIQLLSKYTISNLQINTAVAIQPSQTSIHCQFITPPLTIKPPVKSIYPTVFFQPLSNVQSFANALPVWNGTDEVNSMAGGPVISQTITLNTAPDMIAVYFVPDKPATMDGDPTQSTAVSRGVCLEDTCLPIRKLQISWNNNPSLLATFDMYELWRRTNQNGLQIPFGQFAGFLTDNGLGFNSYQATAYQGSAPNNGLRLTVASSGSPVLLALNKDIPVESGVAAGVAGVYTLQVTAEVINNLPYPVSSGKLFVTPITSQYLVLNAGATSDVIATTASEDVIVNMPVSGDVQAKQSLAAGMHMVGGAMLASSRPRYGPSGVLDMVHRGALTSSGPGLSSYLGVKKPRFEL